MLTQELQTQALQLTRNSIISLFKSLKDNSTQYPLLNDLKNMGAFVSLYVNDELRGCIGRIETSSPLTTTLHDMAVASARSDTRFQSIMESELDKLKIEISILSPLRKIEDISEINPSKHGILIRKGSQSGTFLPQVGQRTGWSTEELLTNCSEGKAGLGPNGWRNADIFIYTAQVFSEF